MADNSTTSIGVLPMKTRRPCSTQSSPSSSKPLVLSGFEDVMLKKGRSQRFNAYNSPHEDLREFIRRAEAVGEILRVKGADWNLEIGTLGEIVNHARAEPPALLFEDVPGYPAGMRLISGATNSSKRLAITLGLPVPSCPLDVVRAYRDRMKEHRPIPPRTVGTGPVLDNIDRDDNVDLLKFP